MGIAGSRIGLPGNALPHELTHVVDLTFIGGDKPLALREGLAEYVQFKYENPSFSSQFVLTAQQLQQLLLWYRPNLIQELLEECGRFDHRFFYNFGVSFVDFLISHSSISTFLNFYAALQRKSNGQRQCFTPEVLDRLFRKYFDLSYSEIERKYRVMLLQTQLTDEGHESFNFILDQIYYRFGILKPLLKDELAMGKVMLSIFAPGKFDRNQARLLQEYLSQSSNYLATQEAIRQAEKNMEMLENFVFAYRGSALKEMRELQSQLYKLYYAKQWEEWRDLYVSVVNKLVTLRY